MYGQGDPEFWKEVMILSRYKHQNIVSLLGFSNESGEKILVYEYHTHKSLDLHLSNADLTWLMRLRICLDAARGLSYLHDPQGTQQRVIHRDIKSSNILLDDNWGAKITDFGLSKLGPANLQHTFLISVAVGTAGYADPLYIETGFLTKESDVYSFGVVLLEVLCGRPAITNKSSPLVRLARRQFEAGTITEIIDPILRQQMNLDSLNAFSAIASQCLKRNREERPTMVEVVEKLELVLELQVESRKASLGLQQVENVEHMKIPLADIKLATRDFHDDFTIGQGVYGKTYKAELFHFDVQKYVTENTFQRLSTAELVAYPRRKSIVVIKRLKHRTIEFMRQVSTCSLLRNQSLVTLVGFCDEDDESIVVYEYSSNGSLDEYICRKDTRNSFPWVIRLQSCLDAANGLNFLHNGTGEHRHSIIHRNIKSSNIFLGRDGVGKIGDFGFSTVVQADSQPEFDTLQNYIDPQYHKTGRFTKKSDVYSFGVVLFEVLTRRLASFQMSKDDPGFLPHMARNFFEQKRINEIIDAELKNEFKKVGASIRDDGTCPDSIKIYAEIAYQCSQEKQADRPTMDYVVKELEKAFKAHVDDLKERQGGEGDSHKILENLKHLKIPFREIYSVTRGLNNRYLIGEGGFGGVYAAELFHVDVRNYVGKNESHGYPRRKSKVALKRLERVGQGRKEFMKEIEILSGLNHQNIISLLGFCDEYGEMILVYDYASKEGFHKYILHNPREYNPTWAQRLQICLDTAQGLNYLHSQHIIHRDIKSANILLGDNWEGMIGDFGLSIINNQNSKPISAAGTPGYIDPKYYEKGILTKQSDIYSFGIVLLEVFCGRLARPPPRGNHPNNLVVMAEHHFPDKKPYQVIADYLREEFEKTSSMVGDEKFMSSINTFAAITHECLHSTETHHLTMPDVLKELKKALTFHLVGMEVISLEEINSATNCFSEEYLIGKGASANVYKGELTLSKGRKMVAVKRLDRMVSYGEGAFLKEVATLSRYIHENITPLRGFCEEENEKIIILEHAVYGSLDTHLKNSTLTWGLRLKISIGAAKGLHYIHNFPEAENTTHGDIKSGNILLHEDWKATISDFILSKGHGTLGYIDPQDFSGEKSDVYSFGVVLFEILSGRLAIEKADKYPQHTLLRILDTKTARNSEDKEKEDKVVFLAWLAARCYEEKILHDIIFHGIKNQTDAKSIEIFSKVAYQCLHEDKEKRPTMAEVIEALHKAYQIHDEWEWEQKLPKDYNKIIQMSKHQVSTTITKKELYLLLCSGIPLDKGRKWFSISSNGGINEMVSSKMSSYKNVSSLKWRSIAKSRFPNVARIVDSSNLNIKMQIRTEFLTPEMMYGAYLVFQFRDRRKVSSRPVYVNLKYKKAGETLHSYFAEWKRGSKWLMVEMFRFWNKKECFECEVLLESFSRYHCGNDDVYLEGIEFKAIHRVESEVSEELKDERNMQGLMKSSSDLENYNKIFLPKHGEFYANVSQANL